MLLKQSKLPTTTNLTKPIISPWICFRILKNSKLLKMSGNLLLNNLMATKEIENHFCSMKVHMINMQLYLMAVKRLEYSEMPCLKLQMWTFANAGPNPMSNGHLRDPILPLFTQRVLPFGVALDFKKSPGWPILVYNLSTIRLVKNTSSLLVLTSIQG